MARYRTGLFRTHGYQIVSAIVVLFLNLVALFYHLGRWLWAFDLAAGDDKFASWLVELLPHVNYIGKRGSFIQFCAGVKCNCGRNGSV